MDLKEDEKLHDAAKWLSVRYPGLFPLQRIEVGVREPFLKDSEGSTNPADGAISIKPGMSQEKVAATLAHEMLHARVGSKASRLKQGVDALIRGAAEHDFIRMLDSVIGGHALLEMQQGRALGNSDLRRLHPSLGVIEYEENGAPTVVRTLSMRPDAREIEYRLPAWSAVRASFERESRQ